MATKVKVISGFIMQTEYLMRNDFSQGQFLQGNCYFLNFLMNQCNFKNVRVQNQACIFRNLFLKGWRKESQGEDD